MDLSGDWALIDDPIVVAYLVRTSESAYAAPVTVGYVQRNSITKEDAVADPALLQRDSSVFHLWTAKLSGITPKIGDKITSGTTWVVRSVGESDRDSNGVQRYRCVCTRSTG